MSKTGYSILSILIDFDRISSIKSESRDENTIVQ